MVRHRLEGQSLQSDAEDLYLRYVARIEDPNAMTSDFRELLAIALARELAVPIANSNSLEQRLDARFRDVLRRARSVDSLDDQPETMPEGSWVTVR